MSSIRGSVPGSISRVWRTALSIRQRCFGKLDRLVHSGSCVVAKRARDIYHIWSQDSAAVCTDLVQPLWAETLPVFASMITGGIGRGFLQHDLIQRMFCRTGFGLPQEHELNYLRESDCWDLVQRYHESPVGRPVIECVDLETSTNTLGMLYYFTRILEHLDQAKLRTIVEFGGGYGNLCRVFFDLLPGPLTYVIVDLPEMLALQYFYLESSSRRYRVVTPTSQPVEIREGRVNLVPVHWVEHLDMTCDLFISTFALSEASVIAQNMVTRREFLGASAIYLVGQDVNAESWGTLELVSMEPVWAAAGRLYPNVRLQPFHFAESWELKAWRNHQ